MSRPTTGPDWATDAAYTHGPVAGQPNKSQPSSGESAEGFIPAQPIPADYLNFKINEIGRWLHYLDSAVGALVFGNGRDGDFTFNGSTTPSWATRSGSVYTLTRDVFAHNWTFGAGTSLKTAGYRVFGAGKLDTTACTPGSIITNNGSVATNGGAGAGGAGGNGAPSGTLGGGANGSVGGKSAPGTAGGSVINALGGTPGGAGGNGSLTAGGAGGTATLPTAVLGGASAISAATVGHVIGSGNLTLAVGGAGGGGGGGAVSGGGGGGGGGGGVVSVFFRELALAGASDIRAAGGNGGSGFASVGTGGGGGGAGGAVFLVYVTKNVTAFTAAGCCPGGFGGVSGGGGAGVDGATGNLYEFQIGESDFGAPEAASQRGVASFASSGSGAGFDYFDVSLAPSMPNTSYEIELSVGMNDDTSGAPVVSYRLKTTGGFRIRPNAKFDGEVSWKATPA